MVEIIEKIKEMYKDIEIIDVRCESEKELENWYRYKFFFKNNIVMSVVKYPSTIGYDDDMWEVGIMDFIEKEDRSRLRNPLKNVYDDIKDEDLIKMIDVIKPLKPNEEVVFNFLTPFSDDRDAMKEAAMNFLDIIFPPDETEIN